MQALHHYRAGRIRRPSKLNIVAMCLLQNEPVLRCIQSRSNAGAAGLAVNHRSETA